MLPAGAGYKRTAAQCHRPLPQQDPPILPCHRHRSPFPLAALQEFKPTALSKGKLQDNMEFMQWFYGYWQQCTGGMEVEGYDAIERRQHCRTGDWAKVRRGSAASTALLVV